MSLLALATWFLATCSEDTTDSVGQTDGPHIRERDASVAEDSSTDAVTDSLDETADDGGPEDMARETADCGVVSGGLFISEIVDPNIELPARARYVELYNGGNQPVSLVGWRLVRHFDPNGVIEVDLPPVAVAPCEAFVIARDSEGFQDVYAMTADWISTEEDIPGSVVDNNGDDAVALADGNGVVDQFGIPAESSGDPSWAYDDSVVTRNGSVIAPSATYQPAEWTVTPTGESTTGNATPGSR